MQLLIDLWDFNAHTVTKSDICQANNFVYDTFSVDEASNDALEIISKMNEFGIPLQQYSVDKCNDNGGYGKRLLEFCQNNTPCIFNGRVGNDCLVGKQTTCHSVIDYVIRSPYLLVNTNKFNASDFDPLFSDKHCVIEFAISVNTVNSNNVCEMSNKKPGKWEKDKEKDYIRIFDLQRVEWLNNNCGDLTEQEITNALCEILLDPALKVFPPKKRKVYVKKSNNKVEKWFDRWCWMKRQDYHRARHRYNKARSESNYSSMLNKSKASREEIKKAKRRKNKSLVKTLRELKHKDPKLYWKLINSSNKQEMPVPLKELFQHFNRMSESEVADGREFNLERDTGFDTNMLNEYFDENEIRACIKALKNNKAVGIYLIMNEYIKCTTDLMMSIYIKLFNKVLRSGCMPDQWLIGIIIPLYKGKGDKCDANNYRGITLLSCLSKLFMSVLNARLNKFCEVNNIILEMQAGFRQGYSTMDHIN